VQNLVAGPGVFICNECVELSAAIVADVAGITLEEDECRRRPAALRNGVARLARRGWWCRRRSRIAPLPGSVS